MYNIRWDTETNGGVLLTSEQGDVQASVRPVFFEELDLLGGLTQEGSGILG